LCVVLGAAYNSHTDPLFAETKSLKLTDIYDYTLAKIGSEVINNITPPERGLTTRQEGQAG
jgi:hypothetical protein